ncbi:MAG: GntR family transcriptional regulator [Desulfobacterales bacterium]|jgi:GntR family transcriptional regulator
MLNSRSPIPLYHQLADILLEKIRSGAYSPGDRIPSENELAARFGVGRPTVRQATDMLIRKHFLVRKRGSGTFVCETHKEVDLFSLAGTTSAFNKKGIEVTTRILQKIRLKRIKSDPKNPFSNQKAYFFSRLSRVEKSPVVIEDIYLHQGLFKGIDAVDLSGRSLSQIVDEHYYMKPDSGRQTFQIGYLSGEKKNILEVNSKTPILIVQRYLHFGQADNAIYSALYCRTEQFVFSQELVV